MGGQTGYLVKAANAALEKRLIDQGTAENAQQAEALVNAGGWTITLNIDKKKQTQLHAANWENQKHLFTWPNDPNNAALKDIEGLNLKFTRVKAKDK